MAKKKGLLLAGVLLVLLLLLIVWFSPTAFARDGLLTRMKVDEYQTQYDLGATRRHDSDVDRVYLFCLSPDEVTVESEEMFEGRPVEVTQILPFLYSWECTLNDSVFRVSVGDGKYYFTIVST